MAITMVNLTSEELKMYWQKEDNVIAFECSDVEIKRPNETIVLVNLDTHKKKFYHYYETDKSDSGEDIAGWWYRNIADGQKVLLIND